MCKPLVSILISTYGQLQYTRKCLDALRHTLSGKLEYELLIIDDCSKDDTVDFLKGLGAGVRIFFNEENRGFAKNNNFLAREAKGKYLCFLNNDVFVEGDWLSPMIKAMEVDKNIGIVGNVQKLQAQKDLITWEWFFLPMETRGILAKVFLPSVPREDSLLECGYSCMLLNTKKLFSGYRWLR